jgi:isopenicillin-N N-acyltransferase-like protein
MKLDRRRFVGSMTVLGAGAMLGVAPVFGDREQPRLAFPELQADGKAGDLGLAQGKAFASQIEYNLAFYRDWLSQSGTVPPARLVEISRGFIPVIGEHFPKMVEEMDGIALGASLRLDEIVLINARTDISAIVDNEVARGKVPGCTALALFGEVDGKPALALGQNWDWDPLMARSPVVLRLGPDEAPPFVTLTEAGMLAKIGFNQHRLGVCLNFLSHRSDGRPGVFGVPIHCLLRAALECQSIEQAVEIVASSPRCASANFLLAQHGADGPEALDLELTPDEVATLSPDGSSLVHTNHFITPSLAAGCTSGRGPSTMARYASARILSSVAELEEADPVLRMEHVLVSREGLPYPISRDSDPDGSIATLAGVIMDLTRNHFIVSDGPPHENPWIERPGVEVRN